jgi:hypothetical protein
VLKPVIYKLIRDTGSHQEENDLQMSEWKAADSILTYVGIIVSYTFDEMRFSPLDATQAIKCLFEPMTCMFIPALISQAAAAAHRKSNEILQRGCTMLLLVFSCGVFVS